MIIGAQKAGTTSLKNYLGQHPKLCTHPHKEFSFFPDQDEFAGGFEAARKRYFPDMPDKTWLLAKNAGLYVDESALQRLQAHNPECKVILILRDPVDRTYSSFLMEKNYGAHRESFDYIEDIARNADSADWRYSVFIRMGFYAEHLAQVYRYFPKENVKIIRYEQLEEDPALTCQHVFSWINVDPTFLPDVSVRHNATCVSRSHAYGRLIKRLLHNRNPLKMVARKILPARFDYKLGEILRNINKTNQNYEAAPEKSIDFLRSFFAPHNERLSEMTGIDFSDWNRSKRRQ